MAKYTVELKDVLDNLTIDIGLTNYPLYEPKTFDVTQYGKDYNGVPITSYRQYLNNRLLKHYYFREIGQETGALFIWHLNNAMEEIMPFYNQMIKSVDVEFNPLWNVEMHETFTHSTSDTGNAITKATGSGNVKSDSNENGTSKRTEDLEQNLDNTNEGNSVRTPNIKTENTIAEMDTAESDLTIEQIKGGGFTSRAKHEIDGQTGTENTTNNVSENGKITNDNTIDTENENITNSTQVSANVNDVTTDNTNTRTETYTRLNEGSSAGLPYSDAIKQWRNIMINIETQIIEDKKIQDCFMLIY